MSPLRKFEFLALLAIALASCTSAYASDNPRMDAEVRHLDDQWSHIKYQVKDKEEQFKEINALALEAAHTVARYPGRVEPLVWQGIITSEEAAMGSLFSQLGYVNAAKQIFEQAESIDPTALKGAVPMSLGVLYYRVPGFPIGFGSDRKARKYLEVALAQDPDGLDANYFYGDFLIEQNEYEKAQTVLQHALDAPVNNERPVWDAGRRSEVQALLTKVRKHLHSSS